MGITSEFTHTVAVSNHPFSLAIHNYAEVDDLSEHKTHTLQPGRANVV